MLADVRNRVRDAGTMSAGQLAVALNSDRESVEVALGYWMNRGDIRKVMIPSGGCSACSGCGPAERLLGECPGSAADSGVTSLGITAYMWMGNEQ